MEFNFSPNIMQIGYTSPIGTFRYYKRNHFQNFFSPYDQKSVLQLFIVVFYVCGWI